MRASRRHRHPSGLPTPWYLSPAYAGSARASNGRRDRHGLQHAEPEIGRRLPVDGMERGRVDRCHGCSRSRGVARQGRPTTCSPILPTTCWMRDPLPSSRSRTVRPDGLQHPSKRCLSGVALHADIRRLATSSIDARHSTAIVRPNVRSYRRELVLSDVFGPTPAAAIGAVHSRNRAAYLAGWFSDGSPERRAAVRGEVSFRCHASKTLTLVARPLRSLTIDVASLDAWDLVVE